MSVVEVAGSNTSTPNLPAPAYAAANARFLITDWVRVAGARLSETGVLFARAARAESQNLVALPVRRVPSRLDSHLGERSLVRPVGIRYRQS